MALKQAITLPSGASGDYLRIDTFEFNRRARRAQAHVALFKDEARADEFPDYPLAVVSILDLAGDKYDEYLGGDALAAANWNIVGQLYAAIKAEPLRPINGIVLSEIAKAQDA
jgi:hypothetical protein